MFALQHDDSESSDVIDHISETKTSNRTRRTGMIHGGQKVDKSKDPLDRFKKKE